MSPQHNRSSLREGPLADLFRRTDAPADAIADGGAIPTDSRYPAKVGLDADPAQILGLADVEPSPAELAPAAVPLVEQTAATVEAWGERRQPMHMTGGPSIRVVGVGGGGTNAVNRMVEAGITGVDFLSINTDAQSLQESLAGTTIHVGRTSTRGLGAGANPDVGRSAAMEQYDEIKDALRGSDMVFIAVGEGGGTGTGAAPVVARIARELGALTVGIVTKPFAFEGRRRAESADAGVQELSNEVDTLIVVPNNRLLSVLERNTSMVDAFKVADDILRQGVQGISELVTVPGLINLDFADVRTIMADRGAALLGIGHGTGESRAIQAAERAVSSPLLETSMDGAKAILLSITGGGDLSLWEINEAAETIREAAHPEANIIFGAMVDEKLGDEVWVTVVATGYEHQPHLQGGGVEVPERRRVRVPDGEPRVERRAPRESYAAPRQAVSASRPSTAAATSGWSVPEFHHDGR
ncbi:Cell division protein FtsZ [Patulibacter medicamentivorans]|uniref:Cell division protein FtsZ n=1 Tax=Patulibacter medicamentivorans TaxID=1097667 RepID=H0EB62_9ACTN|nr:cell division protein FtsZ [Patulibacter medicamentivorans]EHN09079.1 Cell division protein FtsZ [Patulibacter medicamentivorans]